MKGLLTAGHSRRLTSGGEAVAKEVWIVIAVETLLKKQEMSFVVKRAARAKNSVLRDVMSRIYGHRLIMALPPDVRKRLCPSVMGVSKYWGCAPVGGIAPELRRPTPAGHSHRLTSGGKAAEP